MPKSSGASNRARREEASRARLVESQQIDLRLSNLTPEEAEQVRTMLDLRAAGITPELAEEGTLSAAKTKPRKTAAKKGRGETKPRR